ncbi:hypothetical protein NLX86_23870 [Streptomyces sp. A3M-1-3]|uniref:hypothetical protein n=1 Tax=Streptomyces sp. A3M-1-3 TaxID=2962044 RepID=UPI0020B89B18|nr:hypothetical protein [Streptomyces sp. A3M-1-3]MCP3821019.1 hypothetical protein [Streptomyces sp. A3M-1-3]
MGPETRTGRRARLVGAVVVPLAFMLAGISNPALAVAQPADSPADSAPASEAGAPVTGGPPAPPAPPAAPCNDIDSIVVSRFEEFTAVINRGRVFAGRRTLVPRGPVFWQNLSTNPRFPRGACNVTVLAQGNDVWVRVLTTAGRLYETHCDAPGLTLYCGERWGTVNRPI